MQTRGTFCVPPPPNHPPIFVKDNHIFEANDGLVCIRFKLCDPGTKVFLRRRLSGRRVSLIRLDKAAANVTAEQRS